MRTADLHRELRKHGLEEVEIFRSAALKRITFRFSDYSALKITYWANNRNITAAKIVAAVVANGDKAVILDKRALWVPESATVHLQ